MKNKYFFFCLLSLFFSSCEQREDIDFEVPFEGEKLVIYGLISNDFLPQVFVYKSQDVLTQTPDISVSGVSARLHSGIEIVQNFAFIGDIGKTTEQIEFDTHYNIAVQRGDEIITSTQIKLPEIVRITSSDYSFFPDSTRATFSFSFLDPATENDKYDYHIIKKSEGEIMEEAAFLGGNSFGFGASLSDDNFNGETEKVTIEEDLRIPIFDGFELVGVKLVDEIIVKLYHLSPEITQFNESIDDNRGGLGNQFSGQNPPYSNLSDGYGYFGAVTVDSIVINLE